MATLESQQSPISDSTPQYARHLEASSKYPNLAHVRDQDYGFYAAYIIDTFDSLPDTIKNKVSRTAVVYSMPEENVESVLAYREKYPVTIEARVALNKIHEQSPEVRATDIEAIETILFSGNGKKDPFIPWDNQ